MTYASKTQPSHRFGFIGLVGAPNVGKSTLCNQLVGEKIAIVTHKVQTTRVPLRGLYTEASAQVVLVDTPGLMNPKRKLEHSLVKATWEAALDVDRLALIIDAGHLDRSETEALLLKLKGLNRPLDCVLNKIDTCKKPDLLSLADWLGAFNVFDEIFMISALKNDGVSALRTSWAEKVPEGPWHYPKDQRFDASLYTLASEITREALFFIVHDELPYNLSVINERWQTKPDGSVVIHQIIYVARENHKRMILGKGGQTIRRVGTKARQAMMDRLKMKIHLFLHVKVKVNWVDNPDQYAAVGLEFAGTDN